MVSIQKIIIHPRNIRIAGICPKCSRLCFVYLNELFCKRDDRILQDLSKEELIRIIDDKERRFKCYHCGTRSPLSKVSFVKEIKRYIDLCLKHFSTPNDNKLSCETEIIARVEYEREFNLLISQINKPKMGWEVGEVERKTIPWNYCSSCGTCDECGHIGTFTSIRGNKVCGKCKSRDITFSKADSNKCKVCKGTKIYKDTRDIVTAVVSIEALRKLIYKESELIVDG